MQRLTCQPDKARRQQPQGRPIDDALQRLRKRVGQIRSERQDRIQPLLRRKRMAGGRADGSIRAVQVRVQVPDSLWVNTLKLNPIAGDAAEYYLDDSTEQRLR